MKFLNSGKVKDVFDNQDGTLLFRFTDRVSAYDVQFADRISRKGETLCGFAQYWFEKLQVPNHYVKRLSATDMVVKKLDMLPVECVVRGYLYGSYMKRFLQGQVSLPDKAKPVLAARLPSPIFDPTTKAKHDITINRNSAVDKGLLTVEQYDELERRSISIYNAMAEIVDAAGFILADLKLEFGMRDGQIILADSIGPDEYRLWSKASYGEGRVQKSYDKQILRDWLSDTGWEQKFEQDRAAGRKIIPPEIPFEIGEKLTRRYMLSYLQVVGKPL